MGSRAHALLVAAEVADGGTRVSYSVDAQMGEFFWRLLNPLIAPMGQRQFRSDLNRLKEVLEAAGSEASRPEAPGSEA